MMKGGAKKILSAAQEEIKVNNQPNNNPRQFDFKQKDINKQPLLMKLEEIVKNYR